MKQIIGLIAAAIIFCSCGNNDSTGNTSGTDSSTMSPSSSPTPSGPVTGTDAPTSDTSSSGGTSGSDSSIRKDGTQPELKDGSRVPGTGGHTQGNAPTDTMRH